MKKTILVLLLFIFSACAPVRTALSTPAASDTIYITTDNGVYNDLVITSSSGYYGLKVTGSNNQIINPKISGTKQACVYVSGNNNTFTGLDCSNVLTGSGPDADQNAVTVFGNGNKFPNVYIHDITCAGANHCDGFQTWKDSQAQAATNTEVTGIIDLPGQSTEALNKCFQTQDGSSNWDIHNVLCIAPLAAIFTNSTGIILKNNTFIGQGIIIPQGIKFGTSSAVVEDNIFENYTDPGSALVPQSYPAPQLVSDHNCYSNDFKRTADAGDIYADPLLTADYHLQPGSPCVGMGAFPVVDVATPSDIPTSSATATNHPKKTSTPKPIKTLAPTLTVIPSMTNASSGECHLFVNIGRTVCVP